MSDLAALLERVKKATGPNRALDRAINDALGIDNNFHCDAGYTASIDAALALVEKCLPNDCSIELIFDAINKDWYCALLVPMRPEEDSCSEQNEHGLGPKTAPLAILAALLQAKLAEPQP